MYRTGKFASTGGYQALGGREGLSGPVTARKKGQTAVAGVREIRASLKRLGLHACGAYELHKLAACRLVCYRSLANRRGNLGATLADKIILVDH